MISLLVIFQMREKLEVMRQKKQEYLQYQRQVALQRMQEQERDMALRHEQAKQQYLLHQQQQQPMYGPMYGAVPVPGQIPLMQSNPYQTFIQPGQYQYMQGKS